MPQPPDTLSEDGLPPLCRAARLGDATSVKALIEAGADVNAPDEQGGTPLSWATNAETARLLVRAGADIEAADDDNRTPLAAAAELGFPDVVDFLLSLGADPLGSRPDEWQQYARDNQAAAVRRAVRRQDTRAQALISAAARGQADEVAWMLAAGYDPDGRDEEEETALLKAAFSGYTEIVRLLLAAGAAPDAATEPGEWTPLAHALNRNRRDVARLLLQAGADLRQTASGRSLLEHAASGGGTDEVRLLLDVGADPQGKSRAEWARAAREARIQRGRKCQEALASLEALARSQKNE